MGSPKTCTRFLSCFGCGVAAPAAAVVTKNGPTSDPASPAICKAAANISAGVSVVTDSSVGSRLPTAGSVRRPSQAFSEPSSQSPWSFSDGLLKKRLPVAHPPSRGSGSGGDVGEWPSSVFEGFTPWRRTRKPRVRSSYVSPAYDTEDELSPTAGISRSPSASAGGCGGRGGGGSSSSLVEPTLEEEGAPQDDCAAAVAPATAESVPSLKRGGGDGAGGGLGIKDATAEGYGGPSGAASDGLQAGNGPWLRPSATLEAVRQRPVQVPERARERGKQAMQVEEVDGSEGQVLPQHPGVVSTASFLKSASFALSTVAAAAAARRDGVTAGDGGGSCGEESRNMSAASSRGSASGRSSNSGFRRPRSRRGGGGGGSSNAGYAPGDAIAAYGRYGVTRRRNGFGAAAVGMFGGSRRELARGVAAAVTRLSCPTTCRTAWRWRRREESDGGGAGQLQNSHARA
ncbi:hypothetical protein VOLCADRAFT_97492 [Volvox carteri f. nagariensis]|uniref:Uncharacterized protein n=1 Tax=Volvox carteri f. nagariensis TaxID=3068 RepID=D8UCW1_VOLCA|nr:uncharacterized protein VOLCADRAFT_97492 [Volvox carteri f. nagariensis]EFJ42459.1 hypothetical protein VOLCADRAFT_97492 [Volvox carteri f. nagariensis]|eukprot:XP_002956522.1 hypothetical protein VOLCADRAFT_97492 [Volvox carteri f. nagariensis]